MRQFGKNIILLILIFILGSIIAGAVSVGRAIDATEENLKRKMPTLVSVGADEEAIIEEFELTGEFPDNTFVTTELVREIGDLPYVRGFNYSLCAPLESYNLRFYVPEMRDVIERNWAYPESGFPNWFNLIGVSGEELIHIEEGLIEMVGGRTLLTEEINTNDDNGITPALVSSGFAVANQFTIGSVFTLSSMLPDRNASLPENERWLEENLFAKEDFKFEIVGLFDMVDRESELWAGNDADWEVFMLRREILNQIYVPNHATEAIRSFRFDSFNEMDGGIRTEADFIPPVTALFILEDPLYIADFRAAVEPLLPEFIGIDDLSSAFDDISVSMGTLQEIADWVLWIAIGATLLILSLLITLFLRDRRHEIGIYLALGEKRSKIIFQILIEVVTVAMVGVALSIFAGNMISSEMSQTMLRNELIAASNVQPPSAFATGTTFMITGSNSLAGMGFDFEMTPEEMLEQFDASLNTAAIVLIYGVGLTTVVVSTLLPIVYITKLNPKKVLM